MSLEGDGSVHPPPGLFGGGDGTPGRVELNHRGENGGRGARRSSRTARRGPATACCSSRRPEAATGRRPSAIPSGARRTSPTACSRRSGRASCTGSRLMRIGIDVGGTNTDAVLIDGTAVLAHAKTATTADVTGGIVGGAALARRVVRRRSRGRAGGDDRDDPLHERGRRGQAADADRGGAARAAGDGGAAAARRAGPTAAAGARRPRPPLPRRPRVRRPPDLAARPRRAAAGRRRHSRRRASRSIAISSVFSPVNAEFELEAAEAVRGGAARRRDLASRTRSAGSGCSSARTRRS